MILWYSCVPWLRLFHFYTSRNNRKPEIRTMIKFWEPKTSLVSTDCLPLCRPSVPFPSPWLSRNPSSSCFQDQDIANVPGWEWCAGMREKRPHWHLYNLAGGSQSLSSLETRAREDRLLESQLLSSNKQMRLHQATRSFDLLHRIGQTLALFIDEGQVQGSLKIPAVWTFDSDLVNMISSVQLTRLEVGCRIRPQNFF